MELLGHPSPCLRLDGQCNAETQLCSIPRGAAPCRAQKTCTPLGHCGGLPDWRPEASSSRWGVPSLPPWCTSEMALQQHPGHQDITEPAWPAAGACHAGGPSCSNLPRSPTGAHLHVHRPTSVSSAGPALPDTLRPTASLRLQAASPYPKPVRLSVSREPECGQWMCTLGSWRGQACGVPTAGQQGCLPSTATMPINSLKTSRAHHLVQLFLILKFTRERIHKQTQFKCSGEMDFLFSEDLSQ